MKTKNKFLIAIGLVTLIISIVFCYQYFENKEYETIGGDLISKIENYNKTYGKLPNSLSELGVEESMGKGPYYEKKDSSNYIIYFNIGFDHSKVYYSDIKKWRSEP